jgi:hypothetical protein
MGMWLRKSDRIASRRKQEFVDLKAKFSGELKEWKDFF